MSTSWAIFKNKNTSVIDIRSLIINLWVMEYRFCNYKYNLQERPLPTPREMCRPRIAPHSFVLLRLPAIGGLVGVVPCYGWMKWSELRVQRRDDRRQHAPPPCTRPLTCTHAFYTLRVAYPRVCLPPLYVVSFLHPSECSECSACMVCARKTALGNNGWNSSLTGGEGTRTPSRRYRAYPPQGKRLTRSDGKSSRNTRVASKRNISRKISL